MEELDESLYTKVVFLTNGIGDEDNHYSKEFCYLLFAAFYQPVFFFKQNIDEINNSTYAGKGKLEEIRDFCAKNNANCEENKRIEYIACNFELTALQSKNIEKITGMKVIDRSYVILKIFELNAKTKEAKLQVEIAKLEYLKSHLIDNHASYSQVTSGGGAHNKGSGEKQIELDRRKIRTMISYRKAELEEIKLSRRNMRNRRVNSPIPKIAVVGYTNAGKSTLMNRLLEKANHNSDKNVYAQDELFATLETSTRVITTNRYPTFMITDTVGFISNLPIYLVDAFRSTLEEIKEADLIVQVVDISDEYHNDQIETTNKVLKDLGVENIPMVFLLNKYDQLYKNPDTLPKKNELYTSLATDEDIDDILKFISSSLSNGWEFRKVIFPYDKNFNEFLTDNYVSIYKEKEDGYECSVFFNPRTIYKYTYLLG